MRNISLKSGPSTAMPVSSAMKPTDGAEQSVASNGRGLVLYTTNSLDGYSVNGGRSFYPLDPATAFPRTAGGFCCDQVVTYVPSVDRFVWILQYNQGSGGVPNTTQPNVIRVATATSAQLLACNARCWGYYDWTPSDLGAKPPAPGLTPWLDWPNVAFSHGMLSFTVGFGYNPGNGIYGSAIWRFPLAQLGGVIDPTVVPVQAASLNAISGDIRFAPAQNNIFNNGSFLFFANRESTSRLGLVRWLDRDPGPVFFEVDVPSIATQNNDGPSSAAPSRADWSGRYTARDGYVVTGALSGRQVWFGWNSGRDAQKPGGGVEHIHDQPAVEFVAIDTATLRYSDYTSVEYTNTATVNPHISYNGEGVLGVDFMYGGPTIQPSYAVGFLRPDYAASAATVGGAADTTAPLGTSGDFLGLAPDPGQLNCFVAAGSAIKVIPSTATTITSLYHDPHYVVFGRTSHCTVPPIKQTSLYVTSVTQRSDVLTLVGALRPGVSAHVQLAYKLPNGQGFTHDVTADAQGNFSDSATIGSDQVGQWTVTARWFGQGQSLGAQSDTYKVTVTTPTPPPQTTPSTLTLACPASIAFNATFTGTLSPPVAGSNVTITYQRPTPGPLTDTVTTDANGNYSDAVTPDEYGNWSATAHFAGDPRRAPSDSPTCNFTVVRSN